MSLIKIGLIVGLIAAGQYYWSSQSPEKRAELMALLPFTSKPKEPEKPVKSNHPITSKKTIYQTQGKHGEASFSDHYDASAKTRPHVIEWAKGTTS